MNLMNKCFVEILNSIPQIFIKRIKWASLKMKFFFQSVSPCKSRTKLGCQKKNAHQLEEKKFGSLNSSFSSLESWEPPLNRMPWNENDIFGCPSSRHDCPSFYKTFVTNHSGCYLIDDLQKRRWWSRYSKIQKDLASWFGVGVGLKYSWVVDSWKLVPWKEAFFSLRKKKNPNWMNWITHMVSSIVLKLRK